MGQPREEENKAISVTPSSSYILSSSEIERLSLEAVKGNGEAALQLVNYYKFGIFEEDEVFSWVIVGAENENVILEYNAAFELLKGDKDDIRGVYWLRIAALNGNVLARNRLVNRLGLPLELEIPDDISFPYAYENISPQEIAYCKEGALKGNGKASLIVANYYRAIIKDVISAERWYRIGAQNGDFECQYRYGHILKGKEGIYDHERGDFWINKAIENGFSDEAIEG